jgi:carbamoyltransferase
LYILGISAYFHDASAAIFKDGDLIAAIEEEKLSRIKHDYGFPKHAIQYCLDEAKIESSDIDFVVFYEKPFIKFERILKTVIWGFPKTFKLFQESMKGWLFDKLWITTTIQTELNIPRNKIMFSNHHLSHAASSYYCSPFDKSAIVTFDGVGEWATTTISEGNRSNITMKKEIRFPHSLGLIYSVFTAFLGFEINEGEYKVMGMAPYGNPVYTDKVRKVISVNNDGSFSVNKNYISYHYSTKSSYSNEFVKLFGEPRESDKLFFTNKTGYPEYFGDKPDDYEKQVESNQYYADIAASIQKVTEEIVINLLNQIPAKDYDYNLCLAGGVALNSVINGKIKSKTDFKNIYIQPSAGDGGGAIGAALTFIIDGQKNKKSFVMKHAYWGPEFSNEDIKNAIDKYKFKYIYFEDKNKMQDEIVKDLVNNKVIGLFQNRIEWGPRALGNRSIIANPTNPEMKDIVNAKIKFREPYRPFAPSVLEDKISTIFEESENEEVNNNDFMLNVVKVKKEYIPKIPAVSHMGTARVQAVRKSNTDYYNLIKKFENKTKIPLLLNTSFNVKGEPIVCSPEDALNTFTISGLDKLALGNYYLSKES